MGWYPDWWKWLPCYLILLPPRPVSSPRWRRYSEDMLLLNDLVSKFIVITLCLIPAFWFASLDDVRYSRRLKYSSSTSRPFSGSWDESVDFLIVFTDLFESWRERVLNSSSALRTSICDEFISLTDLESGEGLFSEWPLSAISHKEVKVYSPLHTGQALIYCIIYNTGWVIYGNIRYVKPEIVRPGALETRKC